jgi:uncharacterized protein YjbJ (UPF0337 family)
MRGSAKRGKGRLKESLGALTDNKRLKDQGRVEQAAGSARKTADRMSRKVRRKAD